jgi:hypothetical protein
MSQRLARQAREISGIIAELENELSRRRSNLAHGDATLRAFAVASHVLAPGGNGGSTLNSRHSRKLAWFPQT